MSLTNPNTPVSQQDLQDFYHKLLPYMGGSSGQTIQVETLPTASADELGNVYQYIGTTGTYTHGFFYECVSDGEATPTYSWEQTSVQPSTGGGHTIEDSEGTELTQRDTLQFGEGFLAEDDSTNEKTVISPDVMQSGDISDVVTPLPSISNKMPVLFDESGAERVVGWYKYANGTKKPVYEKNIYDTSSPSNNVQFKSMGVSIDKVVFLNCFLTSAGLNTSLNTVNDAINRKITFGVNDNSSSENANTYFSYTTNDATGGIPYRLIVRYTKSTDTAE